MSEHTKEPWEYIEYGRIYSGDDFVADCRHVIDTRKRAEKDAKRIIACINACTGMDDPESNLAALRSENQRLRDLAEDLLKWSKAYPVSVFPEPTPKQVDDVCKSLGFRIDRISAMVLREFTKQWGDKARAALGKE